MTTRSRIDLDRTTAVVEWQWGSVTCSLATPDPTNASIQLTIRLDSTRLRTMYALFDILVPVKLKDLPGTSAIHLRICPSSITSFGYSSSTSVSEAIKQRFDSATLSLNFRLNKNPTILIPTSVREPVVPARPRSGRVLDAVYQLSRVTALSIQIKDAILPNDVLQSISNGVNQGHLKPFGNPEHDISRMYGGEGAKMTTLPKLTPPPYTEDEPSPPPTAPSHDRKRSRQSTDDEHDSISQILAELRTIHKRDAMRATALDALQQENQGLRADNAALRAKLTTLETSHQDLERSHQALEESHEDLEKNVAALKSDMQEEEDEERAEMREDIAALATRVDYIDKGKDEDDFLERVLHEVGSRLRRE